MANKGISIALTTFNGARYLLPQLESIAAQTRIPDQLVISDDCSTDETVELLKRFAADVPFQVKLLINRKRLGVLENFYCAFNHCDHNSIFYCDQDDVWLPGKIEAVEEALAEPGTKLVIHPSSIVGSDLEDYGAGTAPFNRRYGRFPAPVDANAIFGFGHQMAFTREVLELMVNLRPYVSGAPHLSNNFDAYIPFCASLLGAITLLPEPLVRFRRHAAAVSEAGKPDGKGNRKDWVSIAEAARTIYTGNLQICQAALSENIVEAELGLQVAAALAGKKRIASRQVQIAETESLPLVLMSAGLAIGTALAPGATFTNQRRLRDAMIGLLLLARR